jgi:hypothetical protein
MADEKDKAPPPGMLTLKQVCGLLKCSDETVLQLVKRGQIKRAARGLYPLVGTVHGYVDHLRDERKNNTQVAAENGLRQARQREVEIRTAERERRLIDVAEHSDIVDEMAGMFVAGLSALPARVTKDMAMRRQIEAGCDAIRNDIAALAAEKARDVGAGGPASAGTGEDDA